MPNNDEHIAEVEVAVGLIRPLLAGRPSQVQGAILADLLAIWLASHAVDGSTKESNAFRERLLTMHIKMVRALIPVNATEIHGAGQ